jgi:hypothetical protein
MRTDPPLLGCVRPKGTTVSFVRAVCPTRALVAIPRVPMDRHAYGKPARTPRKAGFHNTGLERDKSSDTSILCLHVVLIMLSESMTRREGNRRNSRALPGTSGLYPQASHINPEPNATGHVRKVILQSTATSNTETKLMQLYLSNPSPLEL